MKLQDQKNKLISEIKVLMKSKVEINSKKNSKKLSFMTNIDEFENSDEEAE